MAFYHTRSKTLRLPTPTDGRPTNLVGMNESARGPASMPTEQAGPAFAPPQREDPPPGANPDERSERSVGPLSAGALDPEAPGGLTDPGHLQEALQVSTVVGTTGSGASQTTKTTPQASSSIPTFCGDRISTLSPRIPTSSQRISTIK